ncbi:hypothetical protein F5890DRAFT_1635911 [Lentinula detonsa]|uniref:Metalloenzyme domain-containing protein n=1 Tax=Lentinula detonsa TaxID=2804962 RepID=A0AA38Q439_9AGAR|nr:hypothetical protein F5890DRAFT_1635911 [Lentinula detonsa]
MINYCQYGAHVLGQFLPRNHSANHQYPNSRRECHGLISDGGVHSRINHLSEKYAHVTFFFNGRIKRAFSNKHRYLIPSPKTPTYDQSPTMSVAGVAQKVADLARQSKSEFIMLNFAPPDMVMMDCFSQTMARQQRHVILRLPTTAVVRDLQCLINPNRINPNRINIQRLDNHTTKPPQPIHHPRLPLPQPILNSRKL